MITKRKHLDHLVDTCRLLSINQITAGLVIVFIFLFSQAHFTHNKAIGLAFALGLKVRLFVKTI